MNSCQYIFTNNTKHHIKGDLCKTSIRKNNEPYCWRHKQQIKKEENNQQIKEEDLPNESKEVLENEEATESKEKYFIQLVNS